MLWSIKIFIFLIIVISMNSTLIQDLENKGKCEEVKNITSATLIYMLFCG